MRSMDSFTQVRSEASRYSGSSASPISLWHNSNSTVHQGRPRYPFRPGRRSLPGRGRVIGELHRTHRCRRKPALRPAFARSSRISSHTGPSAPTASSSTAASSAPALPSTAPTARPHREAPEWQPAERSQSLPEPVAFCRDGLVQAHVTTSWLHREPARNRGRLRIRAELCELVIEFAQRLGVKTRQHQRKLP